MEQKHIDWLKVLQTLAESHNQSLIRLCKLAEEILHDEDLAADFIYGVVDLETVLEEVKIQ